MTSWHTGMQTSRMQSGFLRRLRTDAWFIMCNILNKKFDESIAALHAAQRDTDLLYSSSVILLWKCDSRLLRQRAPGPSHSHHCPNISTGSSVCMCDSVCVCVCVFVCLPPHVLLAQGRWVFAYLSPFYEASVCPRNAPRPICHGLLLFGSSSRCLEVELCCALASEKYVLSFLFSSFCSVYLHMFLDGKTMRLGGKVLRTREVRNRIEKKKWKLLSCHIVVWSLDFPPWAVFFFFFFFDPNLELHKVVAPRLCIKG